MSAKSSTAAAFIALILATAALGYAAWATWTLKHALSQLERTQERSSKEMMISLAHTEGQLGRVQEAVRAFDLEQWLATVQGPLIDRLGEKTVATQRQAVREELDEWAQQIESRQKEQRKALTSFMEQARMEATRVAQAVEQLGASLERMGARDEALFREHEETIRAELAAFRQESKEVGEQVARLAQPTAELRNEIQGLGEESRELKKWLEDSGAAADEYRAQITASLNSIVEAAENQRARAEAQIEESQKRWQGLFLTLRENHEAQLDALREALARLEEERTRVLEQIENAAAQQRRQEAAPPDRAGESRESRMKELIEFCSRRPESVLCRDLQVR